MLTMALMPKAMNRTPKALDAKRSMDEVDIFAFNCGLSVWVCRWVLLGVVE